MVYPLSSFFLYFLLLFTLSVNSTQLIQLGSQTFPNIELNSNNFLEEPCSPLNDVWGFQSDEAAFAVVGATNGVAIVNVTNPTDPQVISFPYVGCITEWRDMKVYEDFLYVVNDYTSLCDCSADQQPCQQTLEVEYSNQTQNFRAAEGKAQAPLSDFPGGVSGYLIYPESNLFACEPYQENLTEKIVLIDRGNCTFTEKTLFAQQAGAVGVIIADNTQESIYPSMSGNNSGIIIPGLLIGSNDANTIKNLLFENISVIAELSQDNRQNSSLYQGPDGLYILDISNPSNVSVLAQTHEFFDYAHNILVDPLGRPLLYVCGQQSNDFEDIGGVLILDITNPEDPQLLGNFSVAYIHDIEVVLRSDASVVLYGCAIYDGQLYVIDVTDPWVNNDLNEQIISVTTTIDSPHNTAQTEDGSYLYITHEEFSYPVSIWNSTDLRNITYISEFSVRADDGTSPHNAMVKGTELWMSYYSEGVLVYDIEEDPASPQELGQFDTSSYDNGFHGVWGIYPYTGEEDIAYASDIESGLWILKLIEIEEPSETPSPITTPNESPITTPNASPSVISVSPSFSVVPTSNSTISAMSNNTMNETDNGSGGSDVFMYLAIAAGIVLAVLFIIILAIVVGYFVYKKRVASQTVADDFDGRVDEDDLY